jgi:hypothetical protein
MSVAAGGLRCGADEAFQGYVEFLVQPADHL